MILTVRFVLLLVVAAVMIGLSGRVGPLMPVGVGLVSLSIVLAVGEWLRLRRVRLEVARHCEEKLSLGAENAVRINVRNPGYARLRGAVRDEYPEDLPPAPSWKEGGHALTYSPSSQEGAGGRSDNTFALDLPPRSETQFTYHVIPPKRGDYEFGDIYVRFTGPLGLVTRQIRYPARAGVKVYPNLLEIRRCDLGLRRERPVQPGQRLVRVRGRGTDFESLREYAPDDEFRAVDWKASARRGKLISRQYQEEKSQNVVIVLDCGRVMGPVIAGLTRLDHSINAASVLAHVAVRGGDKVGMMAFGEEVIRYSPPRAGKSQTLNLLRLTYGLKEASGDSNYSRAVPFLARKWTRRSLVVFFTDLVDPESSKPLISQVASLAKKHLCVVVAMSDPAVIEAAHGPVIEPEDAYRSAAARQVLHARKQAAAQLVRLGAVVLDLPPGEFTPAVVGRYLDVKSRGVL